MNIIPARKRQVKTLLAAARPRSPAAPVPMLPQQASFWQVCPDLAEDGRTVGAHRDGRSGCLFHNGGPVTARILVDRPGVHQHAGEPLLVQAVVLWPGCEALHVLPADLVGPADPEFRVPVGGVEVGERYGVHAAADLDGVTQCHRVEVTGPERALPSAARV